MDMLQQPDPARAAYKAGPQLSLTAGPTVAQVSTLITASLRYSIFHTKQYDAVDGMITPLEWLPHLRQSAQHPKHVSKV